MVRRDRERRASLIGVARRGSSVSVIKNVLDGPEHVGVDLRARSVATVEDVVLVLEVG